MKPYDSLSEFYDELMREVPYDRWADRLLDILKDNGIRQGRLLELACGTGRMTSFLLEAGYEVTAVDQSEEMLVRAREHLKNHSGRLRLVASDMLAYDTSDRFDAVVSVCDGFNYLNDLEQLERMVFHCSRLVRPGGLLVFDLSTDWKFRNQLADTVIAESHEEMAFIWENRYDPEARLLEFDLTLFLQEGAWFRREMEFHEQRAHSTEELQELCQRHGFSLIGVHDGYTDAPARPESERIVYIIQYGGIS